jgi:hypothetical protein
MILDVFHYTVSRWDWHDGNVNQMWIQEIEESPDCYRYVAVAYNPRKNTSMVMSKPRCYADTLAMGSYVLWFFLYSSCLIDDDYYSIY